MKIKEKRTRQKGSALVYILIAIALLAALTATFMDSSSTQTSSQNTFNTVTALNSQINFIRSAIQECVLTYPGGDTTQVSTNRPYPFNPNSSANNPATSLPWLASAAANRNVSGVRCPGNPGTSNNHAAIFGGSSGKFLPPKPNLFNDWQYYNGPDGVFFFTGTNKTDAYLATSLTKLDEQYSECEADVINNSANGTAMNLTTAGASGPNCPANTTCFRVWIIAHPQNIYPGDTDGDEATPAFCP